MRAGFTLVELLVTMAIVLLTVGLVLPHVADPGARRLESDARRLADDLASARERAILGGRATTVPLDDVGDGVRVVAVTIGGEPASPSHPLRLEPTADARPRRIRLADDDGRALVVLLPAGLGAAVIEAAP
jgi:prepilin-type N-terminal cleavage/methylation domain-containing protein